MLSFGSPLSEERAARIPGQLAALCERPSTRCGWGGLLLRILAATPGAHGTGIDNYSPDIKRANHEAITRGLANRVTFIEDAAADHLGTTADVVLNTGAWHALGTQPEALATLRTLVNPGGRVLFAAEFWERPPTEADIGRMWPGIKAEDNKDIAGLVDLAIEAGFRPLRIESVTRGEWEDFESGIAADREQWLLEHGRGPATKSTCTWSAVRAIWPQVTGIFSASITTGRRGSPGGLTGSRTAPGTGIRPADRRFAS